MIYNFNNLVIWLALFSVVILSVSCKRNLEEYWDNGNLKTKVEYLDSKKENYRYYEYYQNGQLKIETTYIKGLLVGDYHQYYRNGQLKYLRHYRKGKLKGVEQFYSETGEIKEQRIYKNSLLVEEQNYRQVSESVIPD